MMDLLNQLNNFMAKIEVDYAICGGHAIDLFLGNKTRPHKDLDVSVYWQDRDKIVQHMLNEGWSIYEPCGKPHLHKINNVADQMRIKENIWCIKNSNPHYKFTEHKSDMYAVDFDNSEQTELDFIEFLFNTRKDGYFLYEKNHEIKRSLNTAISTTNSIPYLSPEVVLLYKSSMADTPDYQLDFENTVNKMSAEQLAWFNKSLSIRYPNGHKWLRVI